MELYGPHCYDQSDEINDIRNGLLLNPTLHTQFDKLWFTIVLNNGVYKIRKSEKTPIPDLDEKELTFGENTEIYPGAKFLAHHNRRFEELQKTMKASADPKSYERQDSGATLVYNYDVLDDMKRKWIESNSEVESYEEISS